MGVPEIRVPDFRDFCPNFPVFRNIIIKNKYSLFEPVIHGVLIPYKVCFLEILKKSWEIAIIPGIEISSETIRDPETLHDYNQKQDSSPL